MWEFSITLNVEKREIANAMFLKINDFAKVYEGVATAFEKHGKITIVLGCNDFDKYRFKTFAEEIICQFICEYYKKDFLLTNLNIVVADEVTKDAFIEALLLFDRETDKYIVNRFLVLENKIDLDGLYNFKLKALRDKWMELVNIANENQMYLYSNETFVELIKFLVDNIEVKNDVINIIEQDNQYVILDSQFDEINIDKNLNDNLISCLIYLCPKIINIYCSDILPNHITKLICQLFEKRVKFLSNAD